MQKRRWSIPASLRLHDDAHPTFLYSVPSKSPQQNCPPEQSLALWHRTIPSVASWHWLFAVTHEYDVWVRWNGSKAWFAQHRVSLHVCGAPASSVPHANGLPFGPPPSSSPLRASSVPTTPPSRSSP